MLCVESGEVPGVGGGEPELPPAAAEPPGQVQCRAPDQGLRRHHVQELRETKLETGDTTDWFMND